MTRFSLVETDTFFVDAAGASTIGRTRKTNQDQFLVASLEQDGLRARSTTLPMPCEASATPARATILMVADGMGGSRGGAEASRAALEAVAGYLRRDDPVATSDPRDSLFGLRATMAGALREGQAAVEHAAAETHQPRMGTTLTVGYIVGDRLYVGHVGDSRCYLARAGRLTQLTSDHTVAEQMKAICGESLDPDSPYHHVLWNALTATGISKLEPELRRTHLSQGDAVLLCSDGLTNHVTDTELLERVLKQEPSSETAAGLLELANSRGGRDNITAVVARVLAPAREEVSSHRGEHPHVVAVS